jgi:simple sugar transport system substrate-binding protein
MLLSIWAVIAIDPKEVGMLRVILAILLVSLFIGSWAFAQDEEFIFGVIMVGPKNDGGWSQAHFEGGLYVEEMIPGTKMIFFEELNPAAHPEATLRDVVADMVDQGATLVFTTSDEFEEDTTEVAGEFPDTVLINISGDDVALGGTPSNLGNFTGQLLIPRMIAGCTAALKTETGKIGLVGPLINYETRRDQSSAYLGAKYCWENYLDRDPKDLEFIVKWIGFWFHIPGVTLDPTEETHTMIDGGVDVVISGIDTLEPLKVVEQRREEGMSVYFIGTDSRKVCELSPQEACLNSILQWDPAFENVKAAMTIPGII